MLRNSVESPETSVERPEQQKDASQQQKVKNSRFSTLDPRPSTFDLVFGWKPLQVSKATPSSQTPLANPSSKVLERQIF